MFPFGRMIRDVAHPKESILNNPMRLPEKVAGIPLTEISRKVSERKKDKDKYIQRAGVQSSIFKVY